VKVLVVDDNPGFRETLVTLLDTGDLEVVGQASSGAEALDLVALLEPDVVLMDLRMPKMDGITATRHLKERFPEIGVVALTGMEDQHAVRDMLVAGASGYVLKDSDGDAILNAVMQAAAGGGLISPEVTPSVIEELTAALNRERRRAHELEEAQEALIERAARRHELISRLGHELRTPVTVILGMAQTLNRYETNPEERREMLDRLASRAGDLAKLIERLEAAVESGLTEWADVTAVAGVPESCGGPADPRGAHGQRPRVLARGRGGPDLDPERVGLDRGARDRPRARHPPGPVAAHLRSARAGGVAQQPHAPGGGTGPHDRADVGTGDGRRRDPRAPGAGQHDLPVAPGAGRLSRLSPLSTR
jgi:DNA-binding NarL/FixJ family response regulator